MQNRLNRLNRLNRFWAKPVLATGFQKPVEPLEPVPNRSLKTGFQKSDKPVVTGFETGFQKPVWDQNRFWLKIPSTDHQGAISAFCTWQRRGPRSNSTIPRGGRSCGNAFVLLFDTGAWNVIVRHGCLATIMRSGKVVMNILYSGIESYTDVLTHMRRRCLIVRHGCLVIIIRSGNEHIIFQDGILHRRVKSIGIAFFDICKCHHTDVETIETYAP